jgi:hypothetical protein
MAINSHKPNVHDTNNIHLPWTRANSNMPPFKEKETEENLWR